VICFGVAILDEASRDPTLIAAHPCAAPLRAAFGRPNRQSCRFVTMLVVHAVNSVTKAHSHRLQGKARKRRNSSVISSFLNAELGDFAKRTVT